MLSSMFQFAGGLCCVCNSACIPATSSARVLHFFQLQAEVILDPVGTVLGAAFVLRCVRVAAGQRSSDHPCQLADGGAAIIRLNGISLILPASMFSGFKPLALGRRAVRTDHLWCSTVVWHCISAAAACTLSPSASVANSAMLAASRACGAQGFRSGRLYYNVGRLLQPSAA
jgi:hypothetical protein